MQLFREAGSSPHATSPDTSAKSKAEPPASPGEAPMRERLLAVALGLFSENGYSGTSVSAIVAAAGVTQPMLYYYFRNKQALFEALVEKALVGYDQLLQHDLPAGLSAKEQLIELCRQGLLASEQNPVLTKLLFSLAFSHSTEIQICGRVDAVIQRFLATLEGIIRRGIASGEFLDVEPQDLSWAIYSVMFKSMETALVKSSTDMGMDGMTRILTNIVLSPPRIKQPGTGRMTRKKPKRPKCR